MSLFKLIEIDELFPLMEFFRASGILGVQVRPVRSGERGAAIPVKVRLQPVIGTNLDS